MRKLYLADISKHVGYSKTLCSMVLNGKGNKYGISQKTQQRVLEAAQKLNYTPARYARALKTGRSFFLGLVVTDLNDPFQAGIADRIRALLKNTEYNLVVCCSDEHEEREQHLVEMLLNHNGVDGLIVASTFTNPGFYEQPRFSGIPMVFIDRVVPLFRANYVVVDNYGGALEAVDFLIREGNKKIAALAITPLHLSTIEDRLNGYKTAMRNHNIHDTNEWIKAVRRDHLDDDIEKHLNEIIMNGEKIDAIFSLNIMATLSLLRILKKKEFARLSRIKVACFDDHEMFDFINRKVTSVSQPLDELVRNAHSLLIDLIEGKKINRSFTVLSPRLITR